MVKSERVALVMDEDGVAGDPGIVSVSDGAAIDSIGGGWVAWALGFLKICAGKSQRCYGWGLCAGVFLARAC